MRCSSRCSSQVAVGGVGRLVDWLQPDCPGASGAIQDLPPKRSGGGGQQACAKHSDMFSVLLLAQSGQGILFSREIKDRKEVRQSFENRNDRSNLQDDEIFLWIRLYVFSIESNLENH